jgi:hypothetical protein
MTATWSAPAHGPANREPDACSPTDTLSAGYTQHYGGVVFFALVCPVLSLLQYRPLILHYEKKTPLRSRPISAKTVVDVLAGSETNLKFFCGTAAVQAMVAVSSMK